MIMSNRRICSIKRLGLTIFKSDATEMLGQLDFAINVRKNVCIIIGPRCHFSCSPILLSDGSELQWVDN